VTKPNHQQERLDDLLNLLIQAAHEVSRKKYGDQEEIFRLTNTYAFPEKISELAESFGMMIVKIEAREMRLEDLIERLKSTNDQLRTEIELRIKTESELTAYRDHLEDMVRERTDQLLHINRQLQAAILEHERVEEEKEKLILELTDALANIKQLKGLIPICASCKKIRDDQGFWNDVEAYISQYSEVEFSHGICPECTKKLYPDIYANLVKKGKIIPTPSIRNTKSTQGDQ
jgi:DNA repair exonuclease SbcCD ATPase subunit